MQIFRLLTLISLTGLFLSVDLPPAFSQVCPSVDAVKKTVAKVFKRELDVEKISPSVVPGLCQAVVKHKGQSRMIYTDTKGEFLIAGQVFTADGLNLTAEAVKELNRFTLAELAKLNDLSAFTVGSKGKTVYFVTDPQCPYCKKGEEELSKLAQDGEITAKFILYPLNFHKGSKEESISIICDKKGLEGLKNNYKSHNQCAEGKKKVEDAINLLKSKGITGTPTYIFTDGLPHAGLLKADALRNILSKVRTQ